MFWKREYWAEAIVIEIVLQLDEIHTCPSLRLAGTYHSIDH